MNTADATTEPQRLIPEYLRALDDVEFYEIWRLLSDEARSALGPEFFSRFRKISSYRPHVWDDAEGARALDKAQDQADDVHTICAATVVSEPISWVWRDWIAAGKLHLIGGAPTAGKTTLALALAATITNGEQWPDESPCAERGSVLIWSGEDGIEDTLQPRLEAMGADLTKVHFVVSVSDPHGRRPFDPATDMPALAAKASAILDLRMLIVDPIVSAVAGDSHKNAEVRRGLQPLVDFAKGRNVAVLGITHFSKGTQGRDTLERFTGSLAFGAMARLAFAAAKLKDEAGEEYRAFVRVKSNLGPDGGGYRYTLESVGFPSGARGLRVLWGAPLDGEAREILAEAEADQDRRSAFRDAEDFLREELRLGERAAGEIKRNAEQAGHSWRTVQEVRRRIGVQTRKAGGYFGGRQQWFWALKTQEPLNAQDLPNEESPHLQADPASSVSDSLKTHDAGDSASSGDMAAVDV